MIFLHRQGSLCPFTRHVPSQDVMELLQVKDLPDGSSQIEGTVVSHLYMSSCTLGNTPFLVNMQM